MAVETSTFTGDAPVFGNTYNSLFSSVTATAYYPAGNQTWTEDVMQDYGGDITWVAYELAADEPVQGGEDTQLGGETEGETGGETGGETSGSTSGFTVESPKTGDESNVILSVTLLAAALAALTGFALYGKKRKA